MPGQGPQPILENIGTHHRSIPDVMDRGAPAIRALVERGGEAAIGRMDQLTRSDLEGAPIDFPPGVQVPKRDQTVLAGDEYFRAMRMEGTRLVAGLLDDRHAPGLVLVLEIPDFEIAAKTFGVVVPV